jgi:hypothetical protein
MNILKYILVGTGSLISIEFSKILISLYINKNGTKRDYFIISSFMTISVMLTIKSYILF